MALSPQILFINSDYIKRNTNLNNSVQDDMLDPSIVVAQDKYVQQYLGTDLYNKLRSDIAASTLTGNYITLMNDHVVRVSLWWTMVEVLPNIQSQVDNGGIVNRTSEDSEASSAQQVYTLRSMARDNAEFYTKRMVDYLYDNPTLFPEYLSNTGSDITPVKDPYSQNGIQFSSNLR
jgi:hypothetical protein